MFTPRMITPAIHPSGNPKAKLAVVGDLTSGFDIREMRPFCGPAGTVLDRCLHTAGLIRGATYLTNLIKVPNRKKYKDGNEFFRLKPGKVVFTDEGAEWVDKLIDELNQCDANVIVTMGPASFMALCHLGKLSDLRGYVFESQSLNRPVKVIPTHHPADSLRGMHIYQHLIVADLTKARQEMEIPELVRPQRNIVWNFSNIGEVVQWIDYYAHQPLVGFDIEVINYEVSCISFASDAETACVIPIDGDWSLEDEMIIWRGIQKVLGNPRSAKVVQNGMFDIPFLLYRNGITVRGPIYDTMVGHHILYPDLPKGLGFLGSIYCGSQMYWKNLVKFSNIKGDN